MIVSASMTSNLSVTRGLRLFGEWTWLVMILPRPWSSQSATLLISRLSATPQCLQLNSSLSKSHGGPCAAAASGRSRTACWPADRPCSSGRAAASCGAVVARVSGLVFWVMSLPGSRTGWRAAPSARATIAALRGCAAPRSRRRSRRTARRTADATSRWRSSDTSSTEPELQPASQPPLDPRAQRPRPSPRPTAPGCVAEVDDPRGDQAPARQVRQGLDLRTTDLEHGHRDRATGSTTANGSASAYSVLRARRAIPRRAGHAVRVASARRSLAPQLAMVR